MISNGRPVAGHLIPLAPAGETLREEAILGPLPPPVFIIPRPHGEGLWLAKARDFDTIEAPAVGLAR